VQFANVNVNNNRNVKDLKNNLRHPRLNDLNLNRRVGFFAVTLTVTLKTGLKAIFLFGSVGLKETE